MTPEDTIVCLCARQNFGQQHQQKIVEICRQQAVNWETVFKTASRHNIAPLVYVNLFEKLNGQVDISSTVGNAFKKSYIQNLFVKRGTGHMLRQVLALFAQHKIDVMLVKGEALNVQVYNEPWYTISYDVDLVIKAKPEELDPAINRQIVDTLEAFNHQQNQLKEHIEYDYYEHHDVTMNNVLAVDSARIWREANKIQLHGYDVFVMTPEDTLLTAAIQACRKRFFRLKSLCDIAAIIEKFGDDLNWDAVVSKAHAYECNTILYTALLVTQATIGCSLPEGLLNSLTVNPVRASAIQHLVSRLCRNFSLDQLFDRTDTTLLGREFSWPLVLTYTTYRLDHLAPKMSEILYAWRKPHPVTA